MTINADGSISIPYPPVTEKANGERVRADHVGSDFNALIEGIDNQMDRSGKKAALANISMASHRILNVATPVSASDAATKSYVDNAITNIPDSTTSVKGIIKIATEQEAILGSDGTKAITPVTLNKVVNNVIIDANKQLPPGYIDALVCTGLGTNVNINPGYCRDYNNTVDMHLSSLYVKNASLLWSKGTNVGGLAPNVSWSASSTYFIIAIGTTPVDATRGTLTTANIVGNLTYFQAVSDGYCKVTVNSVAQNITGLDFTACTSLTGVAEVFNNSALAGVHVDVVSNKLVFTSLTAGASSSINISTIVGVTGTDLTLQNYLYISSTDTTIVNGTNFVNSQIDVGIDNNGYATNLLNTSGAAYQAGYRYYRTIGRIITDAYSNIYLCDNTEVKLASSLNNITTIGRRELQNLLTPNYESGTPLSVTEGTTHTMTGYGIVIMLVSGLSDSNTSLTVKYANSSGPILAAGSCPDAITTVVHTSSFQVYPGMKIYVDRNSGGGNKYLTYYPYLGLF